MIRGTRPVARTGSTTIDVVNQDYVGAPPPRPRVAPLVVLVAILLVLAIGLGVLAAPRLAAGFGAGQPGGPVGGPGMSAGPSQSGSPRTLTSRPVVEAIDLTPKPVVGAGWRVVSGTDNMDERYVTPCGVLVSIAEFAELSAIMTGYDIATGAELWSFRVSDVTGQSKPTKGMWEVSYTPSCEMLVGFQEELRPDPLPTVYVIVDLADGSSRAIYLEGLNGCWAAGDGWAACLYQRSNWAEPYIMSVELATATPGWVVDAPDAFKYAELNGVVAAGRIWTPGGYADPATGYIEFGADVKMYPLDDHSPKTEVRYFPVTRPGGYMTDLVVRLEGKSGQEQAKCKVQLWDPATDAPVWTAEGTIACGWAQEYHWGTEGGALIISSFGASEPRIVAFALADGHVMWDKPGQAGSSPWDDGGSLSLMGTSGFVQVWYDTSGDYAVERAVRIADGKVLTMPEKGSFAASETTVYFPACPSDPSPCRLTAYRPDPDKPEATPEKLWSIEIPNNTAEAKIWTFATGGKMYVVVISDQGADVIPLG